MAALREAPRSASRLLRPSSLWHPCTASFRRCASTEAPAAGAAAHDLETESSLAAPILSRTELKVQDPRRRASQRQNRLPHQRYQYHPPKYNRGPLHPVQSPSSTDPVARDFVPGPFNVPRLKHTYESTIASDIMTMTYMHKAPGTAPAPLKERLRSWDDSSPYMINRPKRGPRGPSTLFPIEQDITWQNVPELQEVTIATYVPQAVKNPDHLIAARAVLMSITGAYPENTRVKRSVAQWHILKGQKAGVKVTLYGNQAYEFLDKCIHLVFPKIKEWQGIKGGSGDRSGNIAWGFTGEEMSHFPEVEATYSMYPGKMIPGCKVFVKTTAKSNRHARLLLKSMGMPFHGKLED